MPEPLTLVDAKNFLKIEHDADNGLIAALIETSRLQVEAATGMALDDDTTPAPTPLVHAMRLLVAHWYEMRNQPAEETVGAALPVSVHALVAPYREMRL